MSTVSANPPAARRVPGLLVNAVLVLGVGMFLLVALGPHLLGYRTSTMLTGSMEPGISPGDVVITVPKRAADLAVGDVIAYRIPVEDHRVETHRVTEVGHRGGTTTFRTRGDDNRNVDPWTAGTTEDTVWVERGVVPWLGTGIRELRTPLVQHGLFWVALGGLLLVGLSRIWGSSDSSEADGSQEGVAWTG